MGITIQLDETLAAQLRSEASARRLSIEQLSHSLLTEAVQRIEVSSRWGARNQRRIELIRKSTRVNLTPEEQAKLDELQAELHERLEATDQQLLNSLVDLENAVLP